MNASRRKRIAALNLSNVLCELEAVRDEEQEAYDNMPESLQNSGQGHKMVEVIDGFSEVISAIESLTGIEL